MADLDLRSMDEARRLVGAAAEAGGILAGLSQEAIDAILDAIHRAAVPMAEHWARLAHEETGFGNVADKTEKNRFAADHVYRFIRPLRTVGVLREDPDRRVTEIAAPAGVVAAIIPSTNPTSTAINKILIALKAACPIVLSPHPDARGCVNEVCRVLDGAAREAGAPPGAILCMTEVSQPGTRELMQHPQTAIILATGGQGLVRAAYSSGKPAYGVGPGNVPAYVDRSAEPGKAARDIVTGKCFDNGVLCSAENAVVAHGDIDERLREAMREAGSLFLDEAQTEALSRVMVSPSGALSKAIVGRSASVIATMAGLEVPDGTRCLVAPLTDVGPEAPLSREKLSPVLAYYVERDWEAACERCLEILAYGGMGHTMAVHATDTDLIRRFALGKPVFRLVVNTPSAVGAVGLTTGVDPSLTLGCGALGGNITSDNITPMHLVNVKRLAFETRPYGATAAPEPGPRPIPLPLVPQRLPNAPPPCALRAPPAPRACSAASPNGPRLAGPALRDRVEALLRTRPLPGAPGDVAAARPCVAPAPSPTPPSPRVESASPGRPEPVPFVCEADVRQALSEERKITISGRTIITPAARDLGTAHRIFVLI
jgi:acetaldehyde dehydrogenase (acetylating)